MTDANIVSTQQLRDDAHGVLHFEEPPPNCDCPRCRIAKRISEAADLIDSLRAENDALRRDAERYRWFRANDAFVAVSPHMTTNVTWLDVDELDARIDAALANRPAEPATEGPQ